MASRKAKPPSPQLGLSLPSTSSTDSAQAIPNRLPQGSVVDGRVRPSWPTELEPPAGVSPKDRDTADHATGTTGGSGIDLDSFDDYDESAVLDGIPKLRLLDPPRDAPTVIVEAVGECFEVSRLRDNGTTVACVMWTRKELTELAARITAALEM